MSLRPCYRATCDAPGCAAEVMLPHDRTAACRAQLEAIGWRVVRHRARSASPGASRISYLCPDHRDVRPPGWREARAAVIRRLARAPRPERPVNLDRVVAPTRHHASARYAALAWMLAEVLGSQVAAARALGVSPQRAHQLVLQYEAIIERRRRSAEAWPEPWARRLRAARAIP